MLKSLFIIVLTLVVNSSSLVAKTYQCHLIAEHQDWVIEFSTNEQTLVLKRNQIEEIFKLRSLNSTDKLVYDSLSNPLDQIIIIFNDAGIPVIASLTRTNDTAEALFFCKPI
jgi:hypothetical protein